MEHTDDDHIYGMPNLASASAVIMGITKDSLVKMLDPAGNSSNLTVIDLASWMFSSRKRF